MSIVISTEDDKHFHLKGSSRAEIEAPESVRTTEASSKGFRFGGDSPVILESVELDDYDASLRAPQLVPITAGRMSLGGWQSPLALAKEQLKSLLAEETNYDSALDSPSMTSGARDKEQDVDSAIDSVGFVLNNIEDSLRGLNQLIPEDLIEFATYLTHSDKKVVSAAVQQFSETMDGIGHCLFGELARPVNGDLIIDVLCDVITAHFSSTLVSTVGERLSKIVSSSALGTVVETSGDGGTEAALKSSDSDAEADEQCLELIALLSLTGKHCTLRHGLTRMFELHRYLLTVDVHSGGEKLSNSASHRPSFRQQRLARGVMEAISDSIQMEVLPEAFKARLKKGWSFTCWLKLDKKQKANLYDLVFLQNIHAPGEGMRVAMHVSTFITLVVQHLPADERSKHVFPVDLAEDTWHFIVISHQCSKGPNFQVWVDGKSSDAVHVEYPNYGDGVMQLGYGGFNGQLGQCFLYETHMNEPSQRALRSCGPTYLPPIYRMTGMKVAAFPRDIREKAVPLFAGKNYLMLPFAYGFDGRSTSEILCMPIGFGESVASREDGPEVRCMPHNKSAVISMGGICYAFYMVSPAYLGPHFFNDSQAVEAIKFLTELCKDNMTLLRQLFTMGVSAVRVYVLDYVRIEHRTLLVLHALKKLLTSMEQNDSTRHKSHFVTAFKELIMDPQYWGSASRDVVSSIASYIRTMIDEKPKLMAKVVKVASLLSLVKRLYPRSFGGFSSDSVGSSSSYSVDASNMKIAEVLLEATVTCVRNSRNKNVDEMHHWFLAELIDTCVDAALKSELLTAYGQLCQVAGECMYTHLVHCAPLMKVLVDCLVKDANIHVRMKASKILMGFIRFQKKFSGTTPSTLPSLAETSAEAKVLSAVSLDKGSVKHLTLLLGSSLGGLEASWLTYNALLDVVLGKFRLVRSEITEMKSDDAFSGLVHDEDDQGSPSPATTGAVGSKDMIKLGHALEGLMEFVVKCKDARLRTRMLADLQFLVTSNDLNARTFLKEREWDRWFVTLVSLDTVDVGTRNECNEIVANIAAELTWKLLLIDGQGFLALYRLWVTCDDKIEMLLKKQADSSGGSSSYTRVSADVKQKCRILYGFLVRVCVLVMSHLTISEVVSGDSPASSLSDSSLTDVSSALKNPHLTKNIGNVLNITERLVFNHRYSMLNLAPVVKKEKRDIRVSELFETEYRLSEYLPAETSQELLCLRRCLQCSLQFVSFKTDRQIVLRRLLRYFKEAMAHPSCRNLFDDCMAAAREFVGRLNSDGASGPAPRRRPKSGSAGTSTVTTNVKTMRIAYSFLKNVNSRLTGTSEGAICRGMMEEIFRSFGPALFTDNSELHSRTDMSLDDAERSLDAAANDIHSLFVFLQHQHYWESVQAEQLTNFKTEYTRYMKDTRRLKHSNKTSFVKQMGEIRKVFDEILRQKVKNWWLDSLDKVRKNKGDTTRSLQKYMKFFDEEYRCRMESTVEGSNPEEYWQIDSRETDAHVRWLLIRDFEGSSHEEAAHQKVIAAPSSKRPFSSSEPAMLRRLSEMAARSTPKSGSPETTALSKSVSEEDFISSSPLLSPVNDEHSASGTVIMDEDFPMPELSAADSGSMMGRSADMGGMDRTSREKYLKARIEGRVLFKCRAIQISPLCKIEGTVYITEQNLTFEGQSYVEDLRVKKSSDKSDEGSVFGQIIGNSGEEDLIEYEVWPLNFIRSILPRRYILRETAFEVWIAGTAKSFFFNFDSRKIRNDAMSLICKNSARLSSSSLRHSAKKILKESKITQKWQRRELSNFDYLMRLNVLSGRSYNDITQYPVFPWVIADFTSKRLNLDDDKSYRDLSKPVGALNDDRLEIFQEKYNDAKIEYESNPADSLPPFHYGTHYMSAGIVLHYLIRCQPFTTLAINLQGGRFDIADRLFSSIPNAWHLSLTNVGDVKEVVPELYYFPDLLRNINRLPLGTRQDGNPVKDVELPPWANSPEEFVRLMREALGM